MNASACPSPHSRRLATQWWLRQEKGFGEVLAALVERGIEPLGMNVPVKTAAKRQRPQWRKPRGVVEVEAPIDRDEEQLAGRDGFDHGGRRETAFVPRTDKRRVGKEGDRTCRSRWRTSNKT